MHRHLRCAALAALLVCLLVPATASADHWNPPSWWHETMAGGEVVPPGTMANRNNLDCVLRHGSVRPGFHATAINCMRRYPAGFAQCGGSAMVDVKGREETYTCWLWRDDDVETLCEAHASAPQTYAQVAPWGVVPSRQRGVMGGQQDHRVAKAPDRVNPNCLEELKRGGDTKALTVRTSGRGDVTGAPDGTSRHKKGKRVTLRARGGVMDAFKRWSGACRGTKPTCKVNMSADRAVTAVFARKDGWKCDTAKGTATLMQPWHWSGQPPVMRVAADWCTDGKRVVVRSATASVQESTGGNEWQWTGTAQATPRGRRDPSGFTARGTLQVIGQGVLQGRNPSLSQAAGTYEGGEVSPNTVYEVWRPTLTLNLLAKGPSYANLRHDGTPMRTPPSQGPHG